MPTPSPKTVYEKLPLRVRLILIRGVLRRFMLNVFRPGYVRKSIARRTGECARCGVCCHLIANKCFALHFHADGRSTCRIYNLYRVPNCCTFPIDPRDLKDRDLVEPERPCGYYWTKE